MPTAERSLARRRFTTSSTISRSTTGNHALQFGSNIRLITNARTSYAAAYDSAVTNPSFYDFSGEIVLLDAATVSQNIFPNISSGSRTDLRDALTAVIGRFSQYGTNLNYDKSGKLIASGQGIARTFKTQEYEGYAQDSWRAKTNLTLTYGLRYSTSTPVYEANGVQVAPGVPLGDYFELRIAGANKGQPYNAPITVDTAGKANDKPGYYPQDWNNFAPSVAVAWSPNYRSGVLKALFGDGNKTSIRGGFRTTSRQDRKCACSGVRPQLGAWASHRLRRSRQTRYNVSSRLGPLFTSLNPTVRGLPGLVLPPSLSFPLTEPSDQAQRIQSSLDANLTTPVNYSFNVSLARDFGSGFSLEVSYVGRLARDLLVTRDVMHLNNLRDPQSGVTWYDAIRQADRPAVRECVDRVGTKDSVLREYLPCPCG